MTSIIIPNAPARASHPLAEFLRTRDGQDFALTVQLSDLLSQDVARFAKRRRLQTRHTLKAMLASLVSCVQAAAPEEEWESVAAILAEELRGRLTVRQVN